MIFEKVYTRDTTIIMQQAWSTALSGGLATTFGWENPHHPVLIQHVNDGVIEFWENVAATEWLKDRLQLEIRSDAGFVDRAAAAYQDVISPFKPLWDRGYANSVGELAAYIDAAFVATEFFIPQFYSGVDERTPQPIREAALRFRESDTFFANSDTVIRESLVSFYPAVRGFETLICRGEVAAPPEEVVLANRKRHAILIAGEITATVALEQYSALFREWIFEGLGSSVLDSAVDSIVGKTAYPGIVQGRVRILRLRDHVDRVREGDILVSPMTTPDFLAAMARAAAFVTDEGGITCHAAIIAREMKKPCVVGTRNATAILRDSDWVEVDADAGIVRIISRDNS